jgi:hypothetical protein
MCCLLFFDLQLLIPLLVFSNCSCVCHIHVCLLRFELHVYISGRRGRRGRIVVGFTTTCAISAYHHESREFEPRSWRGVLDTTLCDKFVSELRQVSGFPRVPRFPPTIKPTRTPQYN